MISYLENFITMFVFTSNILSNIKIITKDRQIMEDDEKRLKQEDCNEDNLGAGILTLTNKRLAFDKTQSRMMDFSKHVGDTVIDVSLNDITKTWKEGWLIKKVCFTTTIKDEEKTFKFGVFNTGDWLKNIEKARDEFTNNL